MSEPRWEDTLAVVFSEKWGVDWRTAKHFADKAMSVAGEEYGFYERCERSVEWMLKHRYRIRTVSR